MTKPRSNEAGPKCPHCGKHGTQVVDSRATAKGIRRNRQCGACGTRWSTLEIPVEQFNTIMRVVANWEFDKPVTRRAQGNFRSRYEVPTEKRAQVLLYRNKGLRMKEIAQLLNLKEKNHV